MDKLEVTDELKKEISRWCNSYEFFECNLVYLFATNKLNITKAVAAILKANPVYIISMMETTPTEGKGLESTIQFIQIGFTGG